MNYYHRYYIFVGPPIPQLMRYSVHKRFGLCNSLPIRPVGLKDCLLLVNRLESDQKVNTHILSFYITQGVGAA